jgi:fructose-1,6-bisphosphatase/inositol monophosphatase family enzyme
MAEIDDQDLLNIGKGAARAALRAIVEQLKQGLQQQIEDVTPNDRPKSPEDRTKAIDQAAEKAIQDYLHDQLGGEGARPYYLVSEELGATKVVEPEVPVEDRGTTDLIIFVDPVDGTDTLIRGMDGAVLLAFYHRNEKKVLAAVVGEVRDPALYYASDSEEGAFRQPLDGDWNDSGDPERLQPAPTQRLKEAHVACLINKRERFWPLARQQDELVDALGQGGRLYSLGGSLSLTRVAAGQLDAAVEFAKGFRDPDGLPGYYLCAKAGAILTDLDGEPFFGKDFAIDLGFSGSDVRARLENLERRQFIAASTRELLEEILTLIN